MNFIIELLHTKCYDLRFNLLIVKKYNTYYVSFSSIGVYVSNLFRFDKIGCNKEDSLRNNMHTNLNVSFYHTNSIDKLYIVHKYKKKLESTNMDLTHS